MREREYAAAGFRGRGSNAAAKSEMSSDKEWRAPAAAADGRSDDLSAFLESVANLLDGLWPASNAGCRRLRELRQRLSEERLNLAVLGQFKRGKSTFLNALLGAPLLPTGVIPLTAVPTFIAWNEEPLIRIIYRKGGEPENFKASEPDEIRNRLFGFVAEQANPENRLGVARVELFYPAEMLRRGVTLIDTPGIGSTYRHNTDAALRVLPDCDAALFVTSADPPVTEAEMAYLKEARAKTGRLVFVLNKADYLGPEEQPVAVSFLRKTLQSAGMPDAPIFCLSAFQGLKSKSCRDSIGWQTSGMAAMEGYLLRYLANEKAESLRAAAIKKSLELLDEAAADAMLRIRTLEIPIDDLERRSAALAEALGRIESEKLVIHDLLAGDRRRAAEGLEADAHRIRQSACRHLWSALEPVLQNAAGEIGEAALSEVIAKAIPELFERELGETSARFSQMVESMLRGHQDRIDGLVDRVRRTAAELFEVPYGPAERSEPFRLKREPYWVTQKWDDAPLLLPRGVLRRFLSGSARRAAFERELREKLADLVERNVENLRWATLQALDDTFRRFGVALDERLAGAVEATLGAARAAANQRRSVSGTAERELARLGMVSKEIAAARNRLAELDPGAS